VKFFTEKGYIVTHNLGIRLTFGCFRIKETRKVLFTAWYDRTVYLITLRTNIGMISILFICSRGIAFTCIRVLLSCRHVKQLLLPHQCICNHCNWHWCNLHNEILTSQQTFSIGRYGQQYRPDIGRRYRPDINFAKCIYIGPMSKPISDRHRPDICPHWPFINFSLILISLYMKYPSKCLYFS
jgi:hypothetical protein